MIRRQCDYCDELATSEQYTLAIDYEATLTIPGDEASAEYPTATAISDPEVVFESEYLCDTHKVGA